MRSVLLVLTMMSLAACGASQRDRARAEQHSFKCRDRLVSYVATKHLVGEELGVQMDCVDGAPRIKRWRMDKNGTRIDDARAISPVMFDDVWGKIDGTGWENLKDCANGTAGKNDPIYVFDVRNDTHKATFQCQSMSMPFPYNSIVDPLDVAAQEGRRQLGDDEPEALKELDRKKGQPAP